MHELRTGDRAFIRELNTSIVLDCIRQNEPVSRARIADITGMGRSTVSGIVGTLQEHGLIISVGTAPSTGGRKPDLLALASDRFFALGVKIEPTHVRAALTDLKGRIVGRADDPLPGQDADDALAAVERVYKRLTHKVAPSSLLGAGVVLPGLVDSSSGVSIDPHFFNWKQLPLRERLEQTWQLPVWLENDARAGALGEKWAQGAPETPSFLFVTVGVGIGAGIVLQGKLMEGGLVGAGHLGHTTVVMDGLPCHCGLRGCLETVANDQALLRYANSQSSDVFQTTQQVFDAAREGHRGAKGAVDTVARHLALAIANVVKVTGISRVVVGGESGVYGGPLLLDSLRSHLRELVFQQASSQVDVVPSRLGNDVWQVGAAALVLEALYMPPIYAETNRVLERVIPGETS